MSQTLGADSGKADSGKIDAGMQWYVVRVASNCEGQVERSLRKDIETADLAQCFGQILVPTESVVEVRGGQKRKTDRKLFPGYIFIQMEMTDQSWFLVRRVTRVLGFVDATRGRKPVPVPLNEMQSIFDRMESGVDKPRPKVVFEAGEVVRVTEGPFADFSGVVEDVNYEKNRIRVAVLIFGRSTPVELEFSQVEKSG